ncbi:uncharacterized protein RJT20DRAFT_52991 [Scheffersomyces xylosifermentans]|uniref:uncharacterized protein n=1 Tax=Scheffersomyces xylosifermentans TaxID=1304137 RepID=UPI00315D68CB
MATHNPLDDPAVSKWIKIVLVLLAARVPKPVHWASFLSLHPLIRRTVLEPQLQTEILNRIKVDSKTLERRSLKTSNVISSAILYLATASTPSIPKDYISIYLWLNYYGKLNPPSAKDIVISPKYSQYLKIDNYKNKTLTRLYENKEFIIYPLIFAQILSNYLTPTRYKLNQKYLSSSIKKRILNPIWINYSLGVNSHYLDWAGLLRSYIFHNIALGLLVTAMSFKDKLLDKYYQLKYGIKVDQSLSEIVKNYIAFVFHKANSTVNFIWAPNLISIFLISLTSPIFTYLSRPSFNPSGFQLLYMRNMKYFFKYYTKIIGFTAAFTTLCINSTGFIPDFGYKAPTESSQDVKKTDKKKNIRQVSKSLLDGINLYLFRLILLSKWRIIKENHPYFRLLNLASWQKLEALVMCYGFYKVMNLRDYIHTSDNLDAEKAETLSKDPLIRLAETVMQ